MLSGPTKSIAIIVFFLNNALYQALPNTNERLEESFQNEAATRDERLSTTNNNDNIAEDFENKIDFRSAGKWQCVKWSRNKCEKWVRVGFWFRN